MNKNNKKSSVQFTLVGILLTLITFFLMGSFLMSTTKTLTSSSQDIACRTFLSAKDSSYVKISEEFLGSLNQRCKMDEISYTFEDREKTFSTTANMMQKCWYRYGEGKYDFLTNVNTQGNWCFTCARVDFKTGGETYEYQAFIEYLKTQKIMIEDEQGIEEEKSLYEYLNVQYADLENESEMYNIKSEIDAILAENEPALNRMALQVNQQYEYIMDLRLKEIDTDEPLYIVYRYDKPDNRVIDTTKQAAIGAVTGLVVSVGTGMAVSWALETATYALIGGAVCAWGGPLALACGAVGGVIGGIVGGVKALSKTSKKVAGMVKKINSIFKKLNKFRVFSKNVERVTEVGIDFSSNIPIGELRVANTFIKKFDSKLSTKFENLIKKMEDIGVKDLEELEAKILQSESKYIEKTFNAAFEVMHDPKLYGKFDEALDIMKKDGLIEIDELNKLKDELINIKKTDLEKLMQTPEGKKKVSNYIKSTIIVANSLAAGAAATDLNFYDYQYVDILTEEQFYRTCGTHTYIPE